MGLLRPYSRKVEKKIMKKTFAEFLLEKKEKIESDDVETKFKDVDCESENLTDEEKEYCASKKLVDFLYRAQQSN